MEVEKKYFTPPRFTKLVSSLSPAHFENASGLAFSRRKTDYVCILCHDMRTFYLDTTTARSAWTLPISRHISSVHAVNPLEA
jgi:hypothetical protein